MSPTNKGLIELHMERWQELFCWRAVFGRQRSLATKTRDVRIVRSNTTGPYKYYSYSQRKYFLADHII